MSMIRFFAKLLISILSDAIGLLAAAIILDGFSIDGVAFVMAVLIFAVSTTVLGPFIAKLAIRNASYLMGGIALITVLVGLILTTIFSNGITINGLSTWILAMLIVWIFAIIGNVILPLLIFKKTLQRVHEDKT